jgi:RHS repeat-associated protein
VGNPFLFTGRRLDPETGLYYFRARYQDPELGRFLQRDPLGYGAGVNLYQYTSSSPTNWVDPFGLEEAKPINCLIVLQYSPDTSEEDQKEKHIAANADLKESAKAHAAKLGADSVLMEVNGTAKFPSALNAFTEKGKKCCKSIEILSHGSPDGALDVPYDLPKFDELRESDKSLMGRKLGGPTAKAGWGSDRLQEFVNALKKALCKCNKPTVTFHGCWTGVEGGIAAQVAALGVRTEGYTGVCQFDHVEDSSKPGKPVIQWPGPRPKEGSEKKAFEPTEKKAAGKGK